MLPDKQQHYDLPHCAPHLRRHVLSCSLSAMLSAQHPPVLSLERLLLPMPGKVRSCAVKESDLGVEYLVQGTCKRGDVCPFAHGVFESWLHPGK